MRLLLIEDDDDVATYVRNGLREAGHAVDLAADGRDGLLMAAAEPYDLLIVDRGLPKLDGLALVKTLRGTGDDTPVLFLTALGTVDQRVEGLRAGGDDYLTKPFAFSELQARIDALHRRRTQAAPETILQVADLELELLSRTARRNGRDIELLPREFALLEFLMRHAGQVVTRTMLLEKVWDYHFDPQTNVIDVHVSRLRSKIDRGFSAPLIHTVRGVGYVLRAPA
ncbi:MAG: response regulator transcription factor [Acidobacteriota bacterium]